VEYVQYMSEAPRPLSQGSAEPLDACTSTHYSSSVLTFCIFFAIYRNYDQLLILSSVNGRVVHIWLVGLVDFGHF